MVLVSYGARSQACCYYAACGSNEGCARDEMSIMSPDLNGFGLHIL
jgi:hypothetical protein